MDIQITNNMERQISNNSIVSSSTQKLIEKLSQDVDRLTGRMEQQFKKLYPESVVPEDVNQLFNPFQKLAIDYQRQIGLSRQSLEVQKYQKKLNKRQSRITQLSTCLSSQISKLSQAENYIKILNNQILALKKHIDQLESHDSQNTLKIKNLIKSLQQIKIQRQLDIQKIRKSEIENKKMEQKIKQDKCIIQKILDEVNRYQIKIKQIQSNNNERILEMRTQLIKRFKEQIEGLNRNQKESQRNQKLMFDKIKMNNDQMTKFIGILIGYQKCSGESTSDWFKEAKKRMKRQEKMTKAQQIIDSCQKLRQEKW